MNSGENSKNNISDHTVNCFLLKRKLKFIETTSRNSYNRKFLVTNGTINEDTNTAAKHCVRSF